MFESLFGHTPQKASIAPMLAFQAKDCLIRAIEARDKFDLDAELKYCINTHLLLGIVLEGVINDIGESYLDSWTWKNLERSSTPLKWRILGGTTKAGFAPSKEPLNIIIELHKLRNEIAHPKSKEQGKDIILVSDNGEIVMEPDDSYIFPEGNLTFYQGYKTLITRFNGKTTMFRFKKAINAVRQIFDLFPKHKNDWPEEIQKGLDDIKATNNIIDKI